MTDQITIPCFGRSVLFIPLLVYHTLIMYWVLVYDNIVMSYRDGCWRIPPAGLVQYISMVCTIDVGRMWSDTYIPVLYG